MTTQNAREIFACVSADPRNGYTVLDGSEVADLMARGLRDAGMADRTKCEIKYDRATTRYQIRAILPAPVEIPDHRGVGRMSSLFLDISGRDDGLGRITGNMGAMIFRCMNASLAQTTGSQWSKIHKGDMSEIRYLVANMSGQFGSVARDLQAVWTRASAEYYLDSESGARLSVPEAIARLVNAGTVPTGGKSVEDAIDAYTVAWRAEGSPASAAGVIDSLTRAAHECTWATKWGQTEIEESASNLLYQNVYTLDAPHVSA